MVAQSGNGRLKDIKWDPIKRVKFTLPLHTQKVDIHFDSIMPWIIELASTSNDKETRVAACEFLHALLIYMIGASANAKVNSNFSKIYDHLFPEMFKLATDSD